MKITIVIPVYNLEHYVDLTVSSALNQKFDGELEVIAVNDGSSDASLSVLNAIAQKDTRLRVISQENAGVSVARNTGIENASGDYITFLDGDDILSDNAVSLLLDSIRGTGIILASARQVKISSQTQNIPSNESKCVIRETDSVLADILTEKFDISACAKLYIREKVGNIRFCSGMKVNEDKYFLFQYLLNNGGKVACLQDNIYGYYMRPGSVSNSRYSEKNLDMLYLSDMIEKNIREHKPEMTSLAKYNNIVTHLAILKNIIRSGVKTEQKQVYKDVKKRVLQIADEIGRSDLIRHRWEINILKFAPCLYPLCVYIRDAIKKQRVR